MARVAARPRRDTIVDLGCGAGNVTRTARRTLAERAYRRCRQLGVDARARRAPRARRRAHSLWRGRSGACGTRRAGRPRLQQRRAALAGRTTATLFPRACWRWSRRGARWRCRCRDNFRAPSHTLHRDACAQRRAGETRWPAPAPAACRDCRGVFRMARPADAAASISGRTEYLQVLHAASDGEHPGRELDQRQLARSPFLEALDEQQRADSCASTCSCSRGPTRRGATGACCFRSGDCSWSR